MRAAPLAALLRRYDHTAVVHATRAVLSEARAAVEGGMPSPSTEDVAERVAGLIAREWEGAPTPVINATGVILHTNIGRAPLSRAAVEAVLQASSYSNLETDLVTGKRDSRQRRAAAMLTALTGAEAALLTGNNAGAMLLCLSVLAAGREVVVSRGQAVEIGGSFRVPDILRESGARLVEVGTTNHTRLSDFQDAIGPDTAALLHVHASNFRIVGFASSVPLAALGQEARKQNVLLLVDNGSGALVDTAAYGLDHEPTPQEAIAAGADIVTFSGDKLLGGPQAGIILGRKDLVERLATSPLARALRPDKLSLGALTATLESYLLDRAVSDIPVWRMIAEPREAVLQRSQRWRNQAAAEGMAVELIDGASTIGGGSLPGSALPSTHLVLPAAVSAERLRTGRPAVLPLARSGRVLLDLRTVAVEEEQALLHAVLAASA
jgi:L-seryl-tRNA(Ser) seleniumtransferase